jgi:hypothetical protein
MGRLCVRNSATVFANGVRSVNARQYYRTEYPNSRYGPALAFGGERPRSFDRNANEMTMELGLSLDTHCRN